MNEYLESIQKRDPAAKSILSIILTYPGFKAVLFHRIANFEETNLESNGQENDSSNEIFSKNKNSNKINQFTETPKLPLPYIKNLRKWINNDKKAS